MPALRLVLAQVAGHDPVEAMSFGTVARRVLDPALPIGLRYIELRHLVESFAPLGFNATWQLLVARFGLREGEPSDSQALAAAAAFMVEWHGVWAARQAAEAEFRAWHKRNALAILPPERRPIAP